MIGLTEQQLQYILDGKLLDVRMTIVPAGGVEQLIVVTSDIFDGTCVLDRNLISGSEFSLGNVESAELMFSLINDEGQFDDFVFEGARVTFELNINGDLKQIGIFTIDQRPTRGELMTVRALDLMARFDRKFKADEFVFPIALGALVSAICDRVNVTDDTGNFVNHDIAIQANDEVFSDCTYRDVLSWVSALAGANAFIAPDGKLVFRLSEQTDLEIAEQDTADIITAESEIEITGVEYTKKAHTEWVDDEKIEIPEVTYLAGEEGYTIDLSDNPLLGLVDDPEECVGDIQLALDNFRYLPVSNLTTVGLPQVVAGDIIRVIEYEYEYPEPLTPEEEEETEGDIYIEPIKTAVGVRTIYVTNHQWVVNGPSVFQSVGETETEKGYASGSDLTPAQKAQITRIIAKSKADLAEELNNTFLQNQLNFHEEIANALGYYVTSRVDEYGRRVTYMHDQPALEESTYIEYKPGPGQLAWTTTGWNNGNPDWQYGISKDGNALFRKILTEGIDIGQADSDYITKLTPSQWQILYRNMPVMAVTEDEMRIPKVITSEYFGVGRIKFVPAFEDGVMVGTDIVFVDDPTEI